MPPLLDLRLFGGFDARLASGPALSVLTKKGRALLAYVALTPGASQSRERVASMLWGGASDQQARASLRQSIAGLRAALKGSTAGRLLAINPFEEGPRRALMGLYLRQGRRAAALRQYQICVATLKRDLGAEPEAETLQLYQSIVGFHPPVVRSLLPAVEPKAVM